MSKRRHNPRRAKIHRNYSVEEAACLYGVHRNTVRQWIKQGLPTSDALRPLLILGADLAAFLTAKRTKNKRPCKPGEIYCIRCRVPQAPALSMAEYQPLTATSGNLVGLCPTCEHLIYRRASLAKLAQVRGKLNVTLTEAQRHIVDSHQPSVNSDFKTGAATHA
ncbi:MAG: hypothetical protein NVS9B10_06000 [Nevskia sp.]